MKLVSPSSCDQLLCSPATLPSPLALNPLCCFQISAPVPVHHYRPSEHAGISGATRPVPPEGALAPRWKKSARGAA